MSRRAVLVGAVVVAVGAAGLGGVAVLRPNLVRNTATDPRTLLYGLGVAVLVVALWLGVRRLTGRSWVAGSAAALPVLAVLALVVVPTFRPTTVDEADPLAGIELEAASATATASPAPPSTTPGATPTPAPTAPTSPREVAAAGLVGLDHDVTGTASLIDLGDGTAVVRFADFDVEPGPDYLVYVVDGAGATAPDGGVLLGPLKGTRGDQNYPVPAGTDVTGPTTVLIWCRAFVTPVAHASLGG